jgi:hypothetical protein
MKNTQSTQQSIDFLHVAEVTLTYVTKVKPSERLVVSCSRDAHKIFFDSWDHSTIEHKETVKMLLLNRATGIEKNKEVTFSYYPNPVSEKLSLTSNGRIETVKIFNISGKMIESLNFDSEAVTIDFSSLKSDIYILEINGFRDSKKNIKIIKK